MKTAVYAFATAFVIASGTAAYLTYSAVHSVGHAVAIGFKLFS